MGLKGHRKDALDKLHSEVAWVFDELKAVMVHLTAGAAAAKQVPS